MIMKGRKERERGKDELMLMKGVYDYDIRGGNCKNEDIKKGKN